MAFRTVKAKKSLTYSIIILLIISGFLVTYLYFFIPDNKRTIHKNGFLILQTIARNTTELISFRSMLYKTFYENAVSGKGADSRSRIERVQAVKSLLKENSIKDSVTISPAATGRDTATIRIEEGTVIITLFSARQQEKVEFVARLQQLLEPILSNQKTELFHSYLLGKMLPDSTVLIYQDKGLALRGDRGIDSLLPREGVAFLKGTRDLELYDVDQKLFYYPFRIRDTQLLLGGMVELKTYNAILRKIPFYFVYTVSILFLLLLVSLPIIKFYVMDSNERVRVSDVFLFGLSIFLGAAMITLIIIHFCLWKGEEKKVFQNLKSLSRQIKKDFNKELQAAYRQLVYLDSCRNALCYTGPAVGDYSDTVKAWVHELAKDTARYFYFNRVSWVDRAGGQRMKADLYAKSVYTNVVRRKYFQVFRKGIPYSLPGYPDRKIGLEPLYSKTNGDFNITISKREQTGQDYIITMAAKMPSVMHTILPDGYGFCVIDEQGDVQLHSDMNRNLNENLFQKVDPAWQIKNAVATRQLKEVSGITLYGKIHQMRVQPLEHLPFCLVTFYDQGYIVPVNMRILVFALSLCFLFVFICWIMWLMLTARYSGLHQLLYCPMDAVSWLIPKKSEAAFYVQGSLFVLFYLVSFLGYVFLNEHFAISNTNILAAMIVTPINIGFALLAIRTVLRKPVGKRAAIRIGNAIHLLGSLLVFFIGREEGLTIVFLLYQFTINAILWIYAFSKRLTPVFSWLSGHRFLRGYNLLATCLVLVLAALPSAMFTWYAHNQELIQSVKRQQFYLADAVYDRSLVIQGIKDTMPDFFIDTWRLSRGIYTINRDSIVYAKPASTPQQGSALFESFYFAFADKMSTPYYKQQPYAVLADVANDSGWYWQWQGPLIRFTSDRSLPELGKRSDVLPERSLVIFSQLPARFVYLGSWKSSTLLGLLVVGLIAALYLWLEKNSGRIFLTRYTAHAAGEATKGTAAPEAGYQAYNRDPAKIHTAELAIIGDMQANQNLYKARWHGCSEKEKSLLFNIARDGLLNYKNSREIIELMKKDLLIIDCERVRLFSPGFRAFILGICTEDNPDMDRIQKKYLENSTWQLYRLPILILLVGMAALVFFTQQGVFDKLLILVGGISTLVTLAMRIMGGNIKEPGAPK